MCLRPFMREQSMRLPRMGSRRGVGKLGFIGLRAHGVLGQESWGILEGLDFDD